jgi:HTH-type transcriptional regulator/antitoxin HipB
MMPIRLNLREWRTLRELTQAELSERAGIRQATISQIENGLSKSVSFDTLERLARALDVHPGQLFTDEKPKKKGK